MQLAEPMTVLTDYLLAALGVWLGRRLWRSARSTADPRASWAGAFWAMAAAAALGGASHGLAPNLDAATERGLWSATLLTLGAASSLLLYAAVQVVVAPGWRRVVAWALAAELAGYCGWVLWIDDDFRVAVVQYGAALVIVLLIHLGLTVHGAPGARWIVAGVVISFLAAAIQQAEIAPHPGFNHNDLYHTVQMAGLWALYRGARLSGSERRIANYIE